MGTQIGANGDQTSVNLQRARGLDLRKKSEFTQSSVGSLKRMLQDGDKTRKQKLIDSLLDAYSKSSGRKKDAFEKLIVDLAQIAGAGPEGSSLKSMIEANPTYASDASTGLKAKIRDLQPASASRADTMSAIGDFSLPGVSERKVENPLFVNMFAVQDQSVKLGDERPFAFIEHSYEEVSPGSQPGLIFLRYLDQGGKEEKEVGLKAALAPDGTVSVSSIIRDPKFSTLPSSVRAAVIKEAVGTDESFVQIDTNSVAYDTKGQRGVVVKNKKGDGTLIERFVPIGVISDSHPPVKSRSLNVDALQPGEWILCSSQGEGSNPRNLKILYRGADLVEEFKLGTPTLDEVGTQKNPFPEGTPDSVLIALMLRSNGATSQDLYEVPLAQKVYRLESGENVKEFSLCDNKLVVSKALYETPQRFTTPLTISTDTKELNSGQFRFVESVYGYQNESQKDFTLEFVSKGVKGSVELRKPIIKDNLVDVGSLIDHPSFHKIPKDIRAALVVPHLHRSESSSDKSRELISAGGGRRCNDEGAFGLLTTSGEFAPFCEIGDNPQNISTDTGRKTLFQGEWIFAKKDQTLRLLLSEGNPIEFGVSDIQKLGTKENPLPVGVPDSFVEALLQKKGSETYQIPHSTTRIEADVFRLTESGLQRCTLQEGKLTSELGRVEQVSYSGKTKNVVVNGIPKDCSSTNSDVFFPPTEIGPFLKEGEFAIGRSKDAQRSALPLHLHFLSEGLYKNVPELKRVSIQHFFDDQGKLKESVSESLVKELKDVPDTVKKNLWNAIQHHQF